MLNSNVTPSAQVFRSFPALTISTATQRNLYRTALYVIDALMLFFAFWLAYVLRFEWKIALRPEIDPSLVTYQRMIVLLIPAWLLLFQLRGLYNPRLWFGGVTEYIEAINACTVGAMFVMAFGFFNPDTFWVARAWLLLAWLLSCFLVGFGRLLMRRLAYLLRRTGYFVAPALIIGVNEEAQIMAEKLRSRVASGFELLGFVDPAGIDGGSDDANSSAVQPVGQHGNSLFGLPIFGSTRKLKEVVQNYGINEVIIARSALHSEQLVEISEQLSGMHNVQMRLSSGLYEVFTTHMHVDTHGSVPLMTINRLRLNSLEAALKTMLDYSLILLSLPFIAPLFALVALLVKLDSSGPVFHRRRVMGVGGRQFDAFKFRTMFVDGDKILEQYPELKQELAANHKLKWDPRITRIGKFLRRTSLDELPQLLNVLRGEMSLVGPRMISPAEQELYGRMKNNLLTVKPGLTGLWQVSGRSDLSYDERVRLDMLYVRNYSIWLDVQILFFQTLPAVLKGSGAY